MVVAKPWTVQHGAALYHKKAFGEFDPGYHLYRLKEPDSELPGCHHLSFVHSQPFHRQLIEIKSHKTLVILFIIIKVNLSALRFGLR